MPACLKEKISTEEQKERLISELPFYKDSCKIQFKVKKGESVNGNFWVHMGWFPGNVRIMCNSQKFILSIYFTLESFIKKKPDLNFVSSKFLIKEKKDREMQKFYFSLTSREYMIGTLEIDFTHADEEIMKYDIFEKFGKRSNFGKIENSLEIRQSRGRELIKNNIRYVRNETSNSKIERIRLLSARSLSRGDSSRKKKKTIFQERKLMHWFTAHKREIKEEIVIKNCYSRKL